MGRRPVIYLAAALALVAVTSVAAGAGSSTAVINGCFNTVTGQLRVDTGTPPDCKPSETAIFWNQVGPEGPRGPQGDPGVQGPPGPSDAFMTYLSIGDWRVPIFVPQGSWTTIGTLALPAGNYVVSASLYQYNAAPTTGLAYCMLLAGGRNAQVIDSLPGPTPPQGSAVSQSLTVAGRLTTDDTATLQCTNNGIGGALYVGTFTMNAIKVGTLTDQTTAP